MKPKKRLSEEAIEAAKERCREYEASMAIEGIILEEDERRIIDHVNSEGMGYEDAIAYAKAELDKLREKAPTEPLPALDEVI